jgi:hypothetical protein
VSTKTLSGLALVAAGALGAAWVTGYSPPAVLGMVVGVATAASAVVGAAAYQAGYARDIADACLTAAAARLLERPRPVPPSLPGASGVCRPLGAPPLPDGWRGPRRDEVTGQ